MGFINQLINVDEWALKVKHHIWMAARLLE
jgi:hypothetical protein